MSADSYNPITGSPVFSDSGAPATGADPTIVAEFAAKVGTRLIGTTAERETYEYGREGLAWFDTELDALFTHTGSGWGRPQYADSGWVTVPTASGMSGTLEVQRVGRVIHLRGSIVGTFAAGSTTTVAVIPDPYRPGYTVSNPSIFSNGEYNWGTINTAGSMFARKTTAGEGTLQVSATWMI